MIFPTGRPTTRRLRSSSAGVHLTIEAQQRTLPAMDTVEQRLQAAGLVLPPPIVPAGNYVPFMRSGNQLFIAGQLCYGPDGKVASEHIGQVGVDVSIENATIAAQCCALNILAQAKAALGSLERIEHACACSDASMRHLHFLPSRRS